MNNTRLNKILTSPHFFTFSVIGLILLRLILNAFVPLMDKTEARYAEIARIMAETNNWITPQIDYGIPFLAKPPLSTWLSAGSIKIFGVNEFAVRLPYLLLSILMIILIGKYAKRKHLDFYLPGLILLMIPEFLLHAGVVSTDTALAFCVALVMLSFWESVNSRQKYIWNYLFFAGIGLGLLAKGPIVVILTLPPIMLWCVLFKKYTTVLKALPWLPGLLLTLLISLPWYFLAEIKSSGFIDYFIVGEHFKRFFDSSWKGDRYGFPKIQPMGIIWLFLLLGALPWIQVVFLKAWKHRLKILKNEWVVYLLFWLLWTPLFFTVSKSLIHPYIMPVMVPIVLLVVHWWSDIKKKVYPVFISFIFPVTLIILLIAGAVNNNIEHYSNSDKYLIENNLIYNDFNRLYHFGKKSYSSQFYSSGKIKNISSAALSEKIEQKEVLNIIITHRDFKKLPESITSELLPIDSNRKKGLYKFRF